MLPAAGRSPCPRGRAVAGSGTILRMLRPWAGHVCGGAWCGRPEYLGGKETALGAHTSLCMLHGRAQKHQHWLVGAGHWDAFRVCRLPRALEGLGLPACVLACSMGVGLRAFHGLGRVYFESERLRAELFACSVCACGSERRGQRAAPCMHAGLGAARVRFLSWNCSGCPMSIGGPPRLTPVASVSVSAGRCCLHGPYSKA